ncbi:hypothetical protein HN836_01130, partial [Candidatus Woesearchaeota archaeon]|nr:hypothetical protein [Candidatus Woesearchaeota archaeon]
IEKTIFNIVLDFKTNEGKKSPHINVKVNRNFTKKEKIVFDKINHKKIIFKKNKINFEKMFLEILELLKNELFSIDFKYQILQLNNNNKLYKKINDLLK